MLLAALALQATATLAGDAPAAAVPQRFSILVPVADQPCVRHAKDEVVVCANALPSQALPLPDEVPSTFARPVNRDATGAGALAAQAAPCAARMGGCQVGVDMLGMGTALIRGVQKLVAPGSCCEEPGEATSTGRLIADVARGIAGSGRRHPDKSRRVAIPLDDPAPGPDSIQP